MQFIAIGVFAGVFSGMFGIGGGIIIVPALIYLFKMPQHTATGTSLVALLFPVGLLAVWEYYCIGKITTDNIKWGLLISIGLFIGAFLGAKLAVQLPETILRRSFSVLLVLMAIKMWSSN